jgi:hypothetical protein
MRKDSAIRVYVAFCIANAASRSNSVLLAKKVLLGSASERVAQLPKPNAKATRAHQASHLFLPETRSAEARRKLLKDTSPPSESQNISFASQPLLKSKLLATAAIQTPPFGFGQWRSRSGGGPKHKARRVVRVGWIIGPVAISVATRPFVKSAWFRRNSCEPILRRACIYLTHPAFGVHWVCG